MRFLNLSRETPAENLALDEALLESAALGHSGDTLRIWESPSRFVVLGTGQCAAEEANLEACMQAGIPVLRRCSAGGCVLQGPGSLNFSLVLLLDAHPEARSLHQSYCIILNRLRDAFRVHGCQLDHAGTSDLSLGGRKVSGNAQRRKREAILHHGTLLHATDYEGMARYLKEPSDRPGYRGDRTHADFVTRLPFSRAELEGIITEAYAPLTPGELTPAEAGRMRQLAEEKYTQDEWNLRR
ncbi:MAG: hypothetical protein RLZZ303_865 [Candidatus Hydrogenedentota bacterium]